MVFRRSELEVARRARIAICAGIGARLSRRRYLGGENIRVSHLAGHCPRALTRLKSRKSDLREFLRARVGREIYRGCCAPYLCRAVLRGEMARRRLYRERDRWVFRALANRVGKRGTAREWKCRCFYTTRVFVHR